ncbi:MAG: hypothetical protein HQ483_16860 [Rhodospirillales bacterium]|nr:hypothetical protein [Rhodospirillales bacterium]
MKNIFLMTLGLLILGACTKPITSWQQPGVSADQWSQDRAECNSWSRRQAEQDYAERPPSNNTDATDKGFRAFMSTYDVKLAQQDLMESCLRRLGYTPTEQKTEEK